MSLTSLVLLVSLGLLVSTPLPWCPRCPSCPCCPYRYLGSQGLLESHSLVTSSVTGGPMVTDVTK